MAVFSPNRGVNEREPTLIGDSQLQDTDGAEYRVGQPGIFQARGRDQTGDLGTVTGKGLYDASFDGGDEIVAHQGNSLHAAEIVGGTLSFSLIRNLPELSQPIVGSHYANRHYIATNVENRRMELVPAVGITTFPIGMSATSLAVGVSITQGAGSFSAVTGLEYWVTEYDSTRGIESIHGSTVNTGVISSLDGVIVTATGTSSNTNTNTLRWYRSTDGGGFPDGGLIQETAVGTTQITDTDTTTGTLSVPSYGIISIGGLDTDRDAAPPIFSTIFGPFQDSLLAVSIDEPRVLRFTPAGFPDSWPPAYGIPLETARRDSIIGGVVLNRRIGVFTNDSVHVIYRLPRDADTIFAAGEAQGLVTDQRGLRSRRGVTVFTPPGVGSLAAWVARDGIWVSNLASSPVPLTDKIDWEGRVSLLDLPTSRLLDDPQNRRLIFIYRRASDTTHNTGLWYLDYQQFEDLGIRVTFADHGPLADAVTIATTDGLRRAISIDSRVDNGQLYIESNQDVDDSQLLNSDGAVKFRWRSKEFLPAGPTGTVRLAKATYMHDAGPTSITHRFYFNRRDSNPEVKSLPNPDTRNASSVVLQRDVQSVSVELESVGTVSYGLHWVDIEGLELGRLGSREGA